MFYYFVSEEAQLGEYNHFSAIINDDALHSYV
jgi:hypothetical protein